MSELLKCFTFLAENAPIWIKSLEGLEEKVKQRQIEVERIAAAPARKLKRTGSNESIRPERDDADYACTAIGTAATPLSADCALAHKIDDAPSGASKRKRIAASALSLTSGSRNTFRTRTRQMIVYYDSEVQKAFEQLVHNIGTGRNHIRKARLAIRMEALTGTSAHARAEEDIHARLSARSKRNGPSRYELLLAQGLRSARGVDTLRPNPATDGCPSDVTDACTVADQGLDKAQGFCETGAYHFLREGECEDEILGARTNFEEIKSISDCEVERLTALELERQKERDAQRLEAHERHRQERADVGAHPALMNKTDDPNKVIEADDDDDEEDDYALLTPPFRMMART